MFISLPWYKVPRMFRFVINFLWMYFKYMYNIFCTALVKKIILIEKMSKSLWLLEIRQSSRLLRFYHLLMVWDIDVKTNQNTLYDPNIADMVSPLIVLTNYLLIKRYRPRYLTFRTAVSRRAGVGIGSI